MRKKNYQGSKDFSEEKGKEHEFLIQIMDDDGKIVKKNFDIKCIVDPSDVKVKDVADPSI